MKIEKKDIKTEHFENDLPLAATIISEFSRLKKVAKHGENPFPVDVFPQTIQDIISETNQKLNFPIDFIGASLLYAVSVAVGNTHRVRASFDQSAVIYLALVGEPGTNKTHPLKWALNPIQEKDNAQYEEYLFYKKRYDNAEEGEEVEKPTWKQHLISDFTPEALAAVHAKNPRGLGVDVDELATWFKNFNRYNKGAEQEFWLSNWSGSAIRINRKTAEPTNIPLPFISVAGTIQPGVIDQLAKDRTENGFIDRILFVTPEKLEKKPWSDETISPEYPERWKEIIHFLLNHEVSKNETGALMPEVLEFAPDAKEMLLSWQKELTEEYNSSQEIYKSVLSKMEMYAMRFSLVLELLAYSVDQKPRKYISQKSVEGALKLVSYFKQNAMIVNSIITDPDPLKKLTSQQLKIYNELPEIFQSKEGENIAENEGMSKRSFRRFRSNKILFEKIKHGEYAKLF